MTLPDKAGAISHSVRRTQLHVCVPFYDVAAEASFAQPDEAEHIFVFLMYATRVKRLAGTFPGWRHYTVGRPLI